MVGIASTVLAEVPRRLNSQPSTSSVVYNPVTDQKQSPAIFPANAM